MDEFLGKDYVMVSEEGFDNYLAYIGFGYFKRKIAVNVRPTQTLRRNEDGTYTFNVRSAIFNWNIDFMDGVEFETIKPDGGKIKGLITIEDNVMTHRQTDENGLVSVHVLEFSPDETIVTTTVDGSDIIAKRIYKLVPAS